MQIIIDLTEEEQRLLHTFTRRLIYEDLIRPMYEAGDTKEDTENRIYKTFGAIGKVKKAIAKVWNN